MDADIRNISDTRTSCDSMGVTTNTGSYTSSTTPSDLAWGVGGSCAGSSYSPGATGGSTSQSVSATVAPHTYRILTNISINGTRIGDAVYPQYDLRASYIESATAGGTYAPTPTMSPVYAQDGNLYYRDSRGGSAILKQTFPIIESSGSNSSQTISTMSPYYALCFIMRISS